MRVPILAAAAVAALTNLISPALAAPEASLNAGYSDVTPRGGGSHIHDWHVDGSLAAPLSGSGWSLQGDVSYNDLSGGVASGQIVNASATAYWTGAGGRIGVTAGDNTFHGLGLPDMTNYGAFGELWVGDRVTLGLKGGSVNGGGASGSYSGVRAIGYLTPDVSLSGAVDQVSKSGARITVSSVQAEWAPVRASPLSVYADYSDMDFAGTRFGIWIAGIKMKFGGANGPLVARDRTGSDSWAAGTTALKF